MGACDPAGAVIPQQHQKDATGQHLLVFCDDLTANGMDALGAAAAAVYENHSSFIVKTLQDLQQQSWGDKRGTRDQASPLTTQCWRYPDESRF